MQRYKNKLLINIAVNLVLVVFLILAATVISKPAHAQDNISVPTGRFVGQYFNNMTLSNPVLTRDTNTIDFDWGRGSPDKSVNSDRFSARFLGNFFFNDGYYQFSALSDDGVRVYLDNKIVIDNWKSQHPTTIKKITYADSGAHQVKVEYFENYGDALLKVNWEKVDVTPTPTGSAIKLRSNNTKAEPNPLISCRQLVANTTEGAAPLKVTFTAEFDDPDNLIDLYIFNFGETVDGVKQEVEQISNSAIYTYENEGPFTASVQARDDNGFLYGGRGVCEVTVNVGNVVPTSAPTIEPTQTPTASASAQVTKLPETGFFDSTLVYLIVAYLAFGYFVFNKFNVEKIKRNIKKRLSAYQMSKNRQFAKQRSKKG